MEGLGVITVLTLIAVSIFFYFLPAYLAYTT
jgi:hypothetical protein